MAASIKNVAHSPDDKIKNKSSILHYNKPVEGSKFGRSIMMEYVTYIKPGPHSICLLCTCEHVQNKDRY